MSGFLISEFHHPIVSLLSTRAQIFFSWLVNLGAFDGNIVAQSSSLRYDESEALLSVEVL